MRLLPDACAFLWLAADDPQLTEIARTSCCNPGNEVFRSAGSACEITLKYRLGRLPLPVRPGRNVTSRRRRLGLEPLALDEDRAAHDTLLPARHRDPGDVGLVSQAILNGML